jgi:hypothetical protein
MAAGAPIADAFFGSRAIGSSLFLGHAGRAVAIRRGATARVAGARGLALAAVAAPQATALRLDGRAQSSSVARGRDDARVIDTAFGRARRPLRPVAAVASGVAGAVVATTLRSGGGTTRVDGSNLDRAAGSVRCSSVFQETRMALAAAQGIATDSIDALRAGALVRDLASRALHLLRDAGAIRAIEARQTIRARHAGILASVALAIVASQRFGGNAAAHAIAVSGGRVLSAGALLVRAFRVRLCEETASRAIAHPVEPAGRIRFRAFVVGIRPRENARARAVGLPGLRRDARLTPARALSVATDPVSAMLIGAVRIGTTARPSNAARRIARVSTRATPHCGGPGTVRRTARCVGAAG